MRKQTLIRKIFPKPIPENIKQDINRAVVLLTEYEPSISEIRLFGSYSKGNFTPGSDIDLGVFVLSPKYSYRTIDFGGDDCINRVKEGSDEVYKLRDAVRKSFENPDKWSVQIFTDKDWPYWDWMFEGREKFIQEQVLTGILLYHHSLPREKMIL